MPGYRLAGPSTVAWGRRAMAQAIRRGLVVRRVGAAPRWWRGLPSPVVATHERELTEPVDLCRPDGRHLADAARGWSRRPLHRANLRGGWGRTKRWDYWAVLTDDLVVSSVYADVDYLGLADVWWCDLKTGATGGQGLNTPFAPGYVLPDRPGTAPLCIARRKLRLAITDDDGGTHLSATWTERDGRPGRMNATVADPPGHESLNVVIPWSDRTFQYTSKHQARPAWGVLEVGDQVWRFGIDSGETGSAAEAWGVLDVGRGRWPYRTNWNWGGGAGRASTATGTGGHGPVVGLQLGGKWTAGTGATENGVIVDGRLTKIGDELAWDYDWDSPLRPWRVRAPDGSLDLELEPRHDKHTRVEAGVMGMEVHQVFGRWSGTVVPDGGDPLTLDGIVGFAEESRSRW